MIHAVEKVMSHYFILMDLGRTTSPGYDGPLGKLFKDGIKTEPIVNFEPMSGDPIIIPSHILNSPDFNNDTRLLYEYYIASHNNPGDFPENLAKKQPGCCHQVR